MTTQIKTNRDYFRSVPPFLERIANMVLLKNDKNMLDNRDFSLLIVTEVALEQKCKRCRLRWSLVVGGKGWRGDGKGGVGEMAFFGIDGIYW